MSDSAAQFKVLKLGVVVDDQLVQEVVFSAKQTISVGRVDGVACRHEAFDVPDGRFDLFVWHEQGYRVRILPGMKGGFTSAGEKVSVAKALKSDATPRDGDVCFLALSDDDKGKLEVGGATVLFRFVEAPAAIPVAPVKMPDFRPRLLTGADPVFSGFLSLFGALGLVFAVWVMNTERPELTFADLDRRFTQIQLPKERPPAQPDAPEEEEVGNEKAEEAKPKEVEPAKVAEAAKPAERSPSDLQKASKDAARDRMLETSALFKQIEAGMIGTTGISTAGSVVMSANGAAGGSLSDQLNNVSQGGSFTDSTGVRGLKGEGGTGSRSLGELGDGLGEGGTVKVAEAPRVKVVKPSVDASGTEFDGGDATGVKAVVRANKGSLLYCHEQALKKNPKVAGKIVVGWTVIGGAATDVYVADNTTDDKELESCVLLKIRRWKFVSVEDGGAKNTFVFQPKEE